MLRTPLSEPLFLLGALFVLVVFFLPGGLTAIAHRRRGAPTGLRRLETAIRGGADAGGTAAPVPVVTPEPPA